MWGISLKMTYMHLSVNVQTANTLPCAIRRVGGSLYWYRYNNKGQDVDVQHTGEFGSRKETDFVAI